MRSKFYTEDYEGEMISVATSWREKNDPSKMTWVEKTIVNEGHGKVAHVIGNSSSRKDFNLEFLNGQTGGSQGVHSVGQSYGCNSLYKDFEPTFLVCVNRDICEDIVADGYAEDNIVYSNVSNILRYPNSFHLYPQAFSSNAGNLATNLACADGHKTVYLVSMDGYQTNSDNIYSEYYKDKLGQEITQQQCETHTVNFHQHLIETMKVYDDVQFYMVVNDLGLVTDDFKWCRNFNEVTYRDYINLASLGAIAR